MDYLTRALVVQRSAHQIGEKMRNITWVKYAFPSFVFSQLMGFTTLIHHLHAAFMVEPDGPGLHVVVTEFIVFPLTVISLFLYLRNGNRVAFWLYIAIAILGFIALGLFEGGWNHTAKIIAYLRVDSLRNEIDTILPTDNIHLWFYEVTGVLTFVVAMLASYYTFLFCSEALSSEHHKLKGATQV